MKWLLAFVCCLYAAVASARGEEEWVPSRSGYVPDGFDISDPIAPMKAYIAASQLVGYLAAGSNSSIRAAFDSDKLEGCWKDSFGRGVGRPIHACPDGKDKDAGLCYDPCRPGYDGVGPVCWEQCKPGYTDTGAFCGKSGKIISSNNKACPWYDVCGLTFSKGCSFCPENDPAYKNDGCTCRIDPHTYAKHSYGRGVGKPMGCSSDEDYDAGLCYKKCPAKYDGVGPVCWQQCPRARPEDYGAVCCKTKDDCKDFIKKVSIATTQFIASAVEAGKGENEAKNVIKKAIETAAGFALFNCQKFTFGPGR